LFAVVSLGRNVLNVEQYAAPHSTVDATFAAYASAIVIPGRRRPPGSLECRLQILHGSV